MELLIRINVCEGPGILQPRDHLESDDDGQTVTPRMQSTSPSLPFGGGVFTSVKYLRKCASNTII